MDLLRTTPAELKATTFPFASVMAALSLEGCVVWRSARAAGGRRIVSEGSGARYWLRKGEEGGPKEEGRNQIMYRQEGL